MASWTTPDDVLGGWIGDDAPEDDALVQRWIARAERLIRREFPDLQARLDDEEPDLLDTVRDVVSAMVTRVFRNPNGHRSVSGQETTGQFSGTNTITFGGDHPGALELLDDERAALRGASDTRGKIGTVSLTGARASIHYPWCNLNFGATYCSCGADIAGYPIYEGA